MRKHLARLVLGKGEEIQQSDACLVCGEPWTQERDADYTVMIVGGEDFAHSWLCHPDCLRKAAHASFAALFVEP